MKEHSSDPLPYTQIDRAVKAKAAVLAGALGLSNQHALGSMAEFWELNGDPREIEKLIAEGKDAVIISEDLARLRFRIAAGKEAPTDLLIELGFLEPVPTGLRVRGMSRYFEPIRRRLQAREAASIGGKASAAARKALTGTAQPQKIAQNAVQESVERDSSDAEATPEANVEAASKRTPKRRGSVTEVADSGQRSSSLKTAPERDSDLLKADFKELTGHEYLWAGAKDGVALADLKKTATIDEIRARWRKGLAEPVEDWASCRTVAQLRAKFNDLVPQAPKPKQVDPLDQRVM